jgi:imidazoleglycerol-phosphate dehydratase
MSNSRSPRTAEVERSTKETQIKLRLALDGTGTADVSTGIGFFDHMLELVARHGRLDLAVGASGDLETGAHHTTEDVGIVLGQALDQALGDRSGIVRYGDAMIPMDEALGACAIDISGRPYCSFDAALPVTSIAGFDTENAEEFFRAVANNAKLTLHLRALEGSNAHHKLEACFKAFARALREAVSLDETETGIPSTKGVL